MNRAVRLMSIAAVLAVPAAVMADYQVAGPASEVFTPIAGTVLNVYTGSSSQDQAVTLPFDFGYFDKTYRTVRVGFRGYLSFDAAPTASTPLGIPRAGNTVVAPWWGSWKAEQGAVTWRVDGVAPNRVAVFQWSRVCYSSDSGCPGNGNTTAFQARLFESSNKLKFSYGENGMGRYSGTKPSAAVGIQSAGGTQGKSGLGCTDAASARCQPTDWQANSAITFSIPADLTLARVYADEIGYAGVPMRMGVTVHNQGGSDANGVLVAFYLSNDGVLDSNDLILGTTRSMDVPLAQKRDVALSAVLANSLAQGRYYLFARVDPNNLITESNKGNNTGPAGGLAFVVGAPAADLVVGSVNVPATAKAGDVVAVSHTIKNVGSLLIGKCGADNECGTGNLCDDQGRCRAACSRAADCRAPLTCNLGKGVCETPACSVDADCGGNEACDAGSCMARKLRYDIYLSDNPVISLADRKLSTTPVELQAGIAAQGEIAGTDSVTLPADLRSGPVYLGLILDPEGELQEISKVNNSGASAQPLVIVSSTVAIAARTLPDAVTQAPYSAHLTATGGDGSYAFSLASGQLPRGLSLSAAGDIAGVPTEKGSFSFKVQVKSGAATATADLTLEVIATVLPLTVLTTQLPVAEFGVAYSTRLSAVGGKAPFAWSLSDGAELPPGLVLASEGLIEGVSRADGTFAFQVEVQDSAGGRQAQPLTLQVSSPDRMHIATFGLPDALSGQPYNAWLSAVGGRAPYAWSVDEARMLPQGATDVVGPPTQELPPGLAITAAGDKVVLGGVPERVGTWALTLKAQDAMGKTDVATLLLAVRSKSSLQIATTALPDAIVGKPYAAQLHAHGAEGTVTWRIACTPGKVRDGEEQVCPISLPEVFSFTPEGILTTGEVEVAAPGVAEGETPPSRTTHRFLVEARDAAGRSAIAALSVTVRVDQPPPSPPPSSTCQTGMGGGSTLPLAAMAVVAMSLLRRRRHV